MIAFCTTCKGRVQHIKATLPRNYADSSYRHHTHHGTTKFVVLDYGDKDGLADYLKSEFSLAIRADRLIVYSFPDAGKFQMAHAKNMVHRCAMLEGADTLCNLDADNFTGIGFDRYIAEQLDNSDTFLWARMVKDGDGRLPRGISGRIVVSSKSFLLAGGYDEKFAAWGPDDKDFNCRLRRMGVEAKEIDPQYLDAIRHNDKMRFREYPHAINNGYHVVDDTSTVANAGCFGMGTVYRNFDFTIPIELGPVPTRIFGVGMHKTATTSLHEAFGLLGIDAAHWKNAHWSKAIWREMKEQGRSPTLERHYALSDLPIAILFRELDKAYPGSKFILTMREEGDWLRSVRNHWDHAKNPFRKAWDTDPFTHKIHREVYGQKGFDADVFVKRYRRHNAEVLDYFKDRPNDLLVMHTFDWPHLCAFLGREVPAVPYPKQFVTQGEA